MCGRRDRRVGSNEALSALAGLTSGREAIILLDEISWIACKDSVCGDVLGKIAKLPGRTKYSVRPVLIYDGELAPGIARSDVFCRLIPAADLLAKS